MILVDERGRILNKNYPDVSLKLVKLNFKLTFTLLTLIRHPAQIFFCKFKRFKTKQLYNAEFSIIWLLHFLNVVILQ